MGVTYTGCTCNLSGYDWLYSWFHGGCMSTAGEVYSSRRHIHTLGLLSWVWHFPPVFSMCTNYDFRLTDERYLPFMLTGILWFWISRSRFSCWAFLCWTINNIKQLKLTTIGKWKWICPIIARVLRLYVNFNILTGPFYPSKYQIPYTAWILGLVI